MTKILINSLTKPKIDLLDTHFGSFNFCFSLRYFKKIFRGFTMWPKAAFST